MPGLLALLAVEHLANGVGNPMGNINVSTLRQRVTPDHLLGRMTASYRFIGRSAMPLGSLCGGALGTWLGLRPTLIVAATGLLLGALWLLPSPVPWLRTFPDSPHQMMHERARAVHEDVQEERESEP
jgi:hypothetical protein